MNNNALSCKKQKILFFLPFFTPFYTTQFFTVFRLKKVMIDKHLAISKRLKRELVGVCVYFLNQNTIKMYINQNEINLHINFINKLKPVFEPTTCVCTDNRCTLQIFTQLIY